MSKASKAGLKSHYEVRLVISTSTLYVASWDEPKQLFAEHDGYIDEGWSADWIDDPAYGSTIGWIDWTKLIAITWRFIEEISVPEETNFSWERELEPTLDMSSPMRRSRRRR